jgi:hypothetical protein
MRTVRFAFFAHGIEPGAHDGRIDPRRCDEELA